MKSKKPKVQWFARCGGIARMGPFPSHVDAAWAIRATDGNPAPGAFIWPEEIPVKAKSKPQKHL